MAALLRNDQDSDGATTRLDAGILTLHDFALASGVRLASVDVAWQDWGRADAPVVVVLGGISAGRNIGSWWKEQCGEGRTLDPRERRLVSIDWLGGADRSSGPAEGEAFPAIDSRDQAHALLAVLNHLGIARVEAIVGASYGACVGQHLAVQLAGRLGRLVVIGAAHRASPWALALRTLQRAGIEAVEGAAAKREALARARQIAVLGYRTPRELEERFGELAAADGVLGWLGAHGERFAQRFPPASFLCLSASLDAHACDPASIRVPTTVVAIDDDLIVPPQLAQIFVDALGERGTLATVASRYGHDAFLKEDGAIAAILTDILEKEVTA